MTIKTYVEKGNVRTTEVTNILVCGGVPSVCNRVPEVTVSDQEVVSKSEQVVLSSNSGNRRDPNPYSMYKQTSLSPIGTYFEARHFGDYTDTTSVVGPGVNKPSTSPDSTITIDESLLYQDCISAMYDKLRGSIDLSVSLAESGQTVRMLRDAAKLSVAISSISPKVWAKRWLSYKYGWYPLVSDLYNVADRIMKRDYSRYTVVSVRRQRNFSSGISPDEFTSGRYTLSKRCLLSCQYDLENPSVTQELAGWTSLNPASLAWELMPYSFVIDWFVDVGSYIRTLESSFVYRNAFRSGFYTHTSRETAVSTYRRSTSSPSLSTSSYGAASETVSTISRNILVASPVPSLPRFEADLGASRLTTMASLLAVKYR